MFLVPLRSFKVPRGVRGPPFEKHRLPVSCPNVPSLRPGGLSVGPRRPPAGSPGPEDPTKQTTTGFWAKEPNNSAVRVQVNHVGRHEQRAAERRQVVAETLRLRGGGADSHLRRGSRWTTERLDPLSIVCPWFSRFPHKSLTDCDGGEDPSNAYPATEVTPFGLHLVPESAAAGERRDVHRGVEGLHSWADDRPEDQVVQTHLPTQLLRVHQPCVSVFCMDTHTHFYIVYFYIFWIFPYICSLLTFPCSVPGVVPSKGIRVMRE